MNDMSLTVSPSRIAETRKPDIRHDWTREEAAKIHDSPLNDLLFTAQTIHRRYFDPNTVQKCQLLNIKSGGCPEDCGYCSQSAKFATGLKATKLMQVQAVIDGARAAKAQGATRYCMGAAWRSPKGRDMDAVCEMVAEVKSLGMETCMTLGMLTADDAARLKHAGLDYYNHNIDTSERYYKEIVTTRSYGDRLATLAHVREAGINVCCGGITGMGEEAADRIDMLVTLANLPEHPGSVPINMLMQVEGTPLGGSDPIDAIDFVRAIATARILMPKSYVRLAAGRSAMSDETQALCFFAGANSLFIGTTLLTTENPEVDHDARLFAKLGLRGEDGPAAH